MKYKEENYIDKQSSNITDDEVSFLNNILEELIDNDFIECIYLVPIYHNLEIAREPMDYLDIKVKVIVNENKPNIINSVMNTIRKLYYNAFNNRLVLSNMYSFQIFSEGEFFAKESFDKKCEELDLVSAYILFDRNKTFENLQDSLNIKPLSKICNISNINEIIVNEKRNVR